MSVAPVDLAALVTALAALAGVLAQLRRQGGKISHIHAQVTPNHGSSLLDVVTRLEHGQRHQDNAIASLGHQLGELHASSIQIHQDHADRLRNLEKRL